MALICRLAGLPNKGICLALSMLPVIASRWTAPGHRASACVGAAASSKLSLLAMVSLAWATSTGVWMDASRPVLAQASGASRPAIPINQSSPASKPSPAGAPNTITKTTAPPKATSTTNVTTKAITPTTGLVTIESDLQQADNSTGVVTATGNVRIVYPDQRVVATARQAQYFTKEGRVVLSGDVDVVQEDGHTVRAERMTYFVNQERLIAEPPAGSQVVSRYRLNAPAPAARTTAAPSATPQGQP